MRRRSLVWVVMAMMSAAALAAAGPARADFNATFCAGGTAAAPWSSGFAGTFDECASGPGLEFLNPSDSMASGSSVGATLPLAGGEEITHVSAAFSTEDATAGSPFFYFGYGDDVTLLSGPMGDDHIGTTVDAAVPDATQAWISVFCAPGSTCAFPGQNVVTLKALTLTIHDTILPTVQATGGDLLGAPVRGGTRTLDYTAGDGGSGVWRVDLSLGADVVATQTPTCQSGALRPCQPSVNGAFPVDTTGLCDGSYPVVLTAYDASGDSTPLTVGTLTRRGHACRQTVTGSHRGQAQGTVLLSWRWKPAPTELRQVRVRGMTRRETLSLRCRGRGCPFGRVSASRRALSHLNHRVTRRVFARGDRLTVTLRASDRRAVRGTFRVRVDRRPVRIGR